MKKKSSFDNRLEETYHIGEMLKQQGKTDAERRAYQHIASILLLIESALHDISIVLGLLLGLEIGKLLSGLL